MLYEPSQDDIKLAQQCAPILEMLLECHLTQQEVRLNLENEEQLVVPRRAIQLLQSALALMATGTPVWLAALDADLSLEQAARVLNLSQTALNERLDRGTLAFTEQDGQRRIAVQAILEYKHRADEAQQRALDQQAALGKELG